MAPPDPRTKPKARSVERHVAAPRDATWAALLAELDEEPLAADVLSLEPPWRRVHQVRSGTGLDIYQATFAIRDDGDECHLVAADLHDAEPDGEGAAFLAEALATMETVLGRVVTRAERASRPPGTGG